MTSVDIVSMPVAERLKLMESLWDSLCAESDKLDSPTWHTEVLEDRLRRLASGEESVASWNDAKVRIRAQAKSN
jgi:putative addiction module component (TIGR02574 family)